MPGRRKAKFILAIHNHDINEVRRLLCTRQIPVNAGASYREPFIECFKVNYRQVRITCRQEDEPKILEMLKLLVQHGADVNVRDLRCSPRGMTAAMIAADQGLERCLRFLVESGADLTITADSGDNTLMMAVRARQVDCVKYLSGHSVLGSLLNQVNRKGDNALMLAAKTGQVDCVKYLTEHSVSGSLLNKVNKAGKTALLMAASSSQDDHGLSVKCLVEAGADVNMQDRAGRTALMLAVDRPSYWDIIRNNDTKLHNTTRVQSLIKGGADLSLQDNEGRNALMIAIERNQSIDILKLLTENMSVSTLNQVNKEGQTALMLAVLNSDDEHAFFVKYLVEAGADLNVQDREGSNALMMAITLTRFNFAKYLTRNVFTLALNQVNKEGKTALMMAASSFQDDHGLSVKCLVEAGADVNVQDRSGRTALMLAVDRYSYWTIGDNDTELHHTSRVQSLIKGEADLSLQDNEGRNALVIAIERNQSIAILKLLTENMSVSTLNQVNKEGQTALMLAASSSQDDHGLSVKCLVEAGTDVNVQDRDGRTALMFAVDRPSYGRRKNDTELHNTSRVQSLIKGGTDLSLQDNRGRNALMIAIQRNQFIAILKLFTENMSVSTLNQVNNDGKTALMMAASCYADEYGLSVKSLVEAGADVNMQDRYGRNALMIAIQRNQSIAILKLLTENMSVSTLNQVNKEGQTALMMAASSSDHQNCICLLIEAGADLNVTDTKTGYTALMCAIHKRNYMAATLLLEKGALVNTVSRDLETPLSFTRSDKGMITQLLSRGLDPALSCRDQGILHTMVAEGEDSVVSSLVMNGFPPVDIKCDVLRRRYSLNLPYRLQTTPMSPLALALTGFPPVDIKRDVLSLYLRYLPQTTPISPLALALTYRHYNIARYLIVNHFFTPYDSVHLCGNHELRQSLQRQIQWTGDTDITRAKKCLEILDFLSARPLSLGDLCLVTISSALSQYLVRDPQDIPPGDSRWMCQPTFKERVELLAVPPALKRELLHQTSYSCIPCESWGDISLEEEM